MTERFKRIFKIIVDVNLQIIQPYPTLINVKKKSDLFNLMQI